MPWKTPQPWFGRPEGPGATEPWFGRVLDPVINSVMNRWGEAHEAANDRRHNEAIRRFRAKNSGERTFVAESKPVVWKPIDQPRRNTMSPREFEARNAPSYETSDGWKVERDGFFNRRRH